MAAQDDCPPPTEGAQSVVLLRGVGVKKFVLVGIGLGLAVRPNFRLEIID